MISDNTTFFLAFAAVFLGFAALLWKLHRDAKRLEFRIQVLEQETGSGPSDATPKNPVE